MDRTKDPTQQRGRPVSGLEAAHASEYFEQFVNASSLKHILGYYRGLIDCLHLKPNQFNLFYPKLRSNLTSWRAKALLKKIDARALHKCYHKSKLANNTRVLIIGGGPCGLRTAIEAQLLGAKVVVVEKRDRFSRNNVLHLWPFVIEDLRMLGAKKFFGKFCAGAIDHISIRQLQCILMKVALLLGVEVHTEVGFEKLIEPNAADKTGWRAEFKPENHPVSHYEFDVIIGADGKKNTLQGFSRKEFRGKLAIAITANFINKKTEAEARVEEISGVAFIFNQKFFKELLEETRIDLENIVYYKDDTHYFVMTAKKASLLEKGVIKQDIADTEKLLAPENVDREALQQYAIEAANFSTNYQMPDLEFAVNHYGKPDIAMFDFTSMYAAENASKVIERNGYRLMMILVGDSLLEPFWPTGSGCARGFLSALDAAWAIRSWSMGNCSPLDVIAERESIYRLLAQTTPDNLNKDWKSYTLDPATRYPNLNKGVVLPHQVICLFDTDNSASIERIKKNVQERPTDVPKKRKRGNVDNEVLLNWLQEQLREETDIKITDLGSIFKDGRILCAIIHHYRPDLLDYNAIKNDESAKNNQLAIDILEKELGIPPVMTGEEITKTEDYLTTATYLTEVYDLFRGEIPHVKHPKLELPESTKMSDLSYKTVKTTTANQYASAFGGPTPARPSSRHKRHAEPVTSKASTIDKKTRKRRTLEKIGASVEERQKTLEEIASNRADRQNRKRQQRKLQTEQFIKSMQMLQANAKPDSQPFEDYSLFVYRQTAPKFEDRVKDLEKQFTYIPDHETKVSTPSVRPGGTDEDLAARIKSLENKWRDPQPIDKKPKDLMRAIGKIETSDWNIKEIEKKIQENKMGKPKTYDKEKVPKWSKEQFIARQTKMEKKHYTRQDSAEAKFAEIDKSIKNLDQKLKEGTMRELGTNKVATITEKLASKVPAEPKPPEKAQAGPRASVVLPPQSASELCHFCGKRVYLMERLSAEARFFHHGCFKCQYCNMQLRLGSYAFDRDGMYGFKFFCQNHFGMVGEPPKMARRPPPKTLNRKSPEKRIPQIAGVDLLDKVQTPERPESAAHSTDHISSDQEDPLSQMDEDEWTDKNFGASCAEIGDSDDDDSSSLSDTDSDDEDAYDDALEEPVTKEGTMKWAERLRNSYSRKRHDSDSDSYSSSDYSYENSSDDDNIDTATEGEEEIRARELRRQEVRVEPPVVQTDTGTDTEVVSDESSSESSSEIQNSATEISTDSEFAQDDPTPTREVPSIVLNDFHVTKVRGSGGNNVPKKIQVTTGYLQRPTHDRPKKPTIELNLKPLVPHTPLVKKPAPVLLPRTEGYALNRTQSTGGIAAKVSLELKKKYLLGESNTGSIQKSGSASTLDTTFKTFHSKISDCQKLLKPAPEISASMQTFCNKLNERKSPVLSPQSSIIFPKNLPEPTKEEEPTKSDEKVFENESEGRPRSPVHETSIIVPNIDWNKKEQSLSSDSLATSSSEDEISSKPKFENIPRVEVHSAIDVAEKEDIPLDSLVVEQLPPGQSETTKSITSNKKSLNQPKQLPNLETLLPDIHNALHIKNQNPDVPETDALKNSSGVSSPESGGEQPTTALTETELSDWARDEVVSDSFEDADFESEKQAKQKDTNVSAKIAKIAEFDDLVGHVCGKEKVTAGFKNKTILTEAMNNILGTNLDNIEFMDTGTETSSEDGQGDSQNGYILLKNEDEFAEDSLNPNINEIVEATNIHILDKGEIKNSGYCIIADDIKQVNKSKHVDIEDDSLLHVETGTTTEENTCSDSTVKNVTEITADKKKVEVENNNIHEVEINNEQNKNEQNKSSQKDTIAYSEHCQRLQSKIEFSNAKDSIDVRKSRRKSKSEAIQKPDLIQEEVSENQKDVTLKLTPTPQTPDILYRKDIIQKERDVNQKLVQEMVMNKMLAEHKSLERKRRNRLSQSPYNLTKSATTDIVSQINLNNLDSNRQSTYSTSSSTYNTPDVLLSTNLIPLQNSKSMNTMPELTMSTDSLNVPAKEQNRPTSLYASFTDKSKVDDNKSVDIVTEDTPKAPPRQHRSADEVNRKLEKLKQSVKARGKENESQTLMENERNNSWVYSNDTLNKKKNAFKRSKSGDYGSHTNDSVTSVPVRTKSIPELQKKAVQIHNIDYEIDKNKIFKSDPNILESDQKNKKKSKDRERRKSITKMITSLFTKKSPTSGSKGLFSKLSPKSKDISKSCANLDLKNAVSEEPVRRKSLSEANIARNVVTPPPIPPLPTNYSVKATDESSDGEYENKIYGHSSCDTLDQSGLVDNSMSSLNSRRSTRSKKAIRHAQRSLAKRHRMAQEIQRKLEETEVKTKELERRGVEVEKALRGEDGGACSKDESELLQEWFDLMRDRTELRRYEKELTIRAQELELEDRHARLQHQLRDKLESGCDKTEEDLKVEKSIIKEMMNIVAQRDSLVAAIEEERLRCTTEDRDLEEQMLAKGLRLTPIKVSPEK